MTALRTGFESFSGWNESLMTLGRVEKPNFVSGERVREAVLDARADHYGPEDGE